VQEVIAQFELYLVISFGFLVLQRS